jgi:serine/threonine-protein kinase
MAAPPTVTSPHESAHRAPPLSAATAPANCYRVFADGAQCGRYRIVRMVAKGGMSEVYEAMHRDLAKRVALKVLSPELAHSAEARARFAAEAVNAASLWHTNVVDITDFGTYHDLPYMVMNLLVGDNLAGLFAQRGRLPAAELIDLVLPVACAVAAGHAQGIMHRDLKPENIFLHQEGRRVIPKLLDFGVSRMLGARRITVGAHVFGTPHYMAPEQARGEAGIGPRADQYALGVILYEGITGRLPRNAESPHALLYTVAFGSFPPPSAHVKLPRELERVILRAMAREPNQRFASMVDLARALVPFASPNARPHWQAELEGTKSRSPSVAVPLARASSSFAQAPASVLGVGDLMRLLVQRPSLFFTGVAALLLLVLASAWTLELHGETAAGLFSAAAAALP